MSERVTRVVESILDNERLTGPLDDDAAQQLIDWGIACAQQIAGSTANVIDDEAAEAAMYPRLRALRRLMHTVSRWMSQAQTLDSGQSAASLDQISSLAATIYGPDHLPPDSQQVAEFLDGYQALSPAEAIARLRNLFETTSSGGIPPPARSDQNG